MCGIYGFIGKPTDSEKVMDIFVDLGIETETRGTHATGYYGVNNGVHLHKAPIKASEFYLEAIEFQTFYSNVPTILMGHNRYASCGDPKINKNNHPFMNERFGFMHNGVCKGWVKKETLEIETESDCDSEWIFRYLLKTLEIHHGNMFSTIKKTMKVFDEATMACGLTDSKQRKLWLFRNIGNPICYIINKELKTLFFASTPTILKAAIEMHNLPTEKIVEVTKGEILCIDEDLNITKEETTGRDARSSSSSWSGISKTWTSTSVPKKVKPVESGTGWKCLKCGKKFLSEYFVVKHLEDIHHLDEEQPDFESYYEDLSHPKTPVFRLAGGGTSRPINRKEEYKQLSLFPKLEKKPVTVIRKSNGNRFTRIYSSFDEMQNETNQILKAMEAI